MIFYCSVYKYNWSEVDIRGMDDEFNFIYFKFTFPSENNSLDITVLMTHPATFQYFSLIIYKLGLYRIVNRITGGVSWYVSYRGSAYRYTPTKN